MLLLVYGDQTVDELLIFQYWSHHYAVILKLCGRHVDLQNNIQGNTHKHTMWPVHLRCSAIVTSKLVALVDLLQI